MDTIAEVRINGIIDGKIVVAAPEIHRFLRHTIGIALDGEAWGYGSRIVGRTRESEIVVKNTLSQKLRALVGFPEMKPVRETFFVRRLPDVNDKASPFGEIYARFKKLTEDGAFLCPMCGFESHYNYFFWWRRCKTPRELIEVLGRAQVAVEVVTCMPKWREDLLEFSYAL